VTAVTKAYLGNGKFFSKQPPARSTVEAVRLPKDVLVEIDVIAVLYLISWASSVAE
jgi:enamine deaminase RidA (YjgF/YER057c/UK114 family)